MAMRKRERQDQGRSWLATSELPAGEAHPFYSKVNHILAQKGFDAFVAKVCRKFYADRMGRPSLAPTVHFRLMMNGYFEGIASEQGMAWRASDSLGL